MTHLILLPFCYHKVDSPVLCPLRLSIDFTSIGIILHQCVPKELISLRSDVFGAKTSPEWPAFSYSAMPIVLFFD